MTSRELIDGYRCADGTLYTVHSEHVRGERRYYWVMRRNPGEPRDVSVAHDGSENHRTVQRLARRLADEHDAGWVVSER